MVIALLFKNVRLGGHAIAWVDVATECAVGGVICSLPNGNRSIVVGNLDWWSKNAAS